MKEQPTAEEFRAFMTRHNLTGSQIGYITGVNPRAVRRWAGGDLGIPTATWRLLQLVTKEITPDDVIKDMPARSPQGRMLSATPPDMGHIESAKEAS